MPAAKTHEQVYSDRTAYCDNGCVIWTGHLCSDGYGKVKKRLGQTLAHRFAYSLFKGEIPAGLQVDHLCKNRRCVNPNHLEAVTHDENVRRADHKTNHRNGVKTHCKRGHEFTPSNTSVEVYGQRRQRKCRKCRADAQRARKAIFKALNPHLLLREV